MLAGCLAVLMAMLGLVAQVSCSIIGRRDRLVEVFDNGLVGGPRGASEGYIWVGKNDLPLPGKTWAPTDPESLTPEQKARIR